MQHINFTDFLGAIFKDKMYLYSQNYILLACTKGIFTTSQHLAPTIANSFLHPTTLNQLTHFLNPSIKIKTFLTLIQSSNSVKPALSLTLCLYTRNFFVSWKKFHNMEYLFLPIYYRISY